MAKKTFYFPHDGNARNDDKLVAVRLRFKMEGYGVYFAILERLLESSDYMCIKDYNIIAFDLRVDAGLIKNIVEDFGLFKFTDDKRYFYSESLIERMIPLDNLREQRSIAGRKSAEKRAEKSDNSTTVQRPLTEKATKESNYIEKDTKVSKKKTSVFKIPTVQEVSAYCIERGNNVDIKKFCDFYESKGWMVGKNKMKDWKACVRTWEREEKEKTDAKQQPTAPTSRLHPALQ